MVPRLLTTADDRTKIEHQLKVWAVTALCQDVRTLQSALADRDRIIREMVPHLVRAPGKEGGYECAICDRAVSHYPECPISQARTLGILDGGE